MMDNMLEELYKLKDLYASGDMKPPVGWRRDNSTPTTRLGCDKRTQYMDYFKAVVHRQIKKAEGGKRLPKLPPKFWTGESQFYWN